MNVQGLEKYLNIDSQKYNMPTLEALNYYIKQYMVNVPFENIDVQNGVKISVEVEDIYDKIVRHHRGGFCYEMNHFFKTYLEQKGFNVKMVSATIHTPNGGRSLKGSHMSLVVTIDDIEYISDVGFGDLPLSAIPIVNEDNPKVVKDITGHFRALYVGDETVIVQKWKEKDWVTQYEADLTSRSIHDFDYNIDYNQTNPNSIFVKQLLITMPQSYGRATMTQNHLTLSKQQDKEQYDITSDNYRQILQHTFGLDVTINRLEPSN